MEKSKVIEEVKEETRRQIANARECISICDANIEAIKLQMTSDINRYSGDELIGCIEHCIRRYRDELSRKESKGRAIKYMEEFLNSL